ncbi:MAG: nuclear transport factor 2 family protein [Acidobacteria bacterium]|nr:nuclear transport factor 2 family protein [Acidobacteriota bacterium]
MPRETRGIVLVLAVAALGLAGSVALAQDGYAEDRAKIEDLQARYMFALDFGDAETYAATFAEDGVLDFGMGETLGRQAIRDLIASMPRTDEVTEAPDGSKLRPAAGRHNITNIVLRIEGNRAVGRAYWFHMGNDNAERSAVLDSFGHYEDELVKVNGEWLFSRRKIYNEQMPNWAAKGGNPAW